MKKVTDYIQEAEEALQSEKQRLADEARRRAEEEKRKRKADEAERQRRIILAEEAEEYRIMCQRGREEAALKTIPGSIGIALGLFLLFPITYLLICLFLYYICKPLTGGACLSGLGGVPEILKITVIVTIIAGIIVGIIRFISGK